MNIAIIYTKNAGCTKKSCKNLSKKLNADVQLIPIDMAKKDCILKYNFIILAASAINGRVQRDFKLYISRNMKNLKEKPLALIINCEEDINRINKTFTEELASKAYIYSNFGYELDPDEGNYIGKKITNKRIKNIKKEGKNLPSLNMDEIENFAKCINSIINKRVD